MEEGNRFVRRAGAALAGLLMAASVTSHAFAAVPHSYRQVNLVSDLPGLTLLPPNGNLKNPWGMSTSPTGIIWISDNGAGVSTLHNPDGTALSRVVTIPAAPGSTEGGKPTGQVFNSTSDFPLTPGPNPKLSVFIFSGEDGTISAWNPQVDPNNAILMADRSTAGAVYKGLALANNGTDNILYATDFHNGAIDMFDAAFHYIGSSSFTDPTLPSGYAPFGIQNIGGKLYVTFAKQKLPDRKDDDSGPGRGFVDTFDPATHVFQRFASQGPLNSPWGLVLAPANFGRFSNDLLVGNFGDGRITAYNPTTRAMLGQLNDAAGQPIAIDGLWGLILDNQQDAEGAHLYFAAGLNDEADGLFGFLAPMDAPTCTLGQVGTDSGHRFADLDVRDTGSGFGSVTITKSVNATTPSVPSPSPSSLRIVRAVQVNAAQPDYVLVEATDAVGNVGHCGLFDLFIPGHPEDRLVIAQDNGGTPLLSFDLQGQGGYHRSGTTPLVTLAGAGRIEAIAIADNQIVVTADGGVFLSRDGFLYRKLPAPLTVTVSMLDGPNRFDPQQVQVHPGDTVVWTNAGQHHHTVNSDPGTAAGGPDSDAQFPTGLAHGDTFSFTVPVTAAPGTAWFYYCRFHAPPGPAHALGPGMTGSITVH